MQLIWFKGIHGEVECKKKYKELVKLHHPDRHNTSDYNRNLATKKFQEIQTEYEWLNKNGWNIPVKEESFNYAKGGYTSNPFTGFNTKVTDDDDVEWTNPFAKTRQSRRGTGPNEWNKEYGYNEEIFREYAKHLHTQQKLIVGLEFYTYQMLLNKESYIAGYNIYIRDFYKKKKQVKDEELEELIDLVNFNFQTILIKDRKLKIKAIIHSICTTWLMQGKNITIYDFERLAKALGLGIDTTGKDLAHKWYAEFIKMFNYE